MRILLQRLVVTAFLLESSCTGTPHGPLAAANTGTDDTPVEVFGPYDPAEGVNRRMFGINMAIDHHVTKPVATAYVDHVPYGARQGVHNFVTNLEEPKVLVNDLLQGNLTRAVNTTGRFVLNSTAGAAGLFDVAGLLKLPHHEADFGQTFGVWGIGPGPVVQLPLLGSSNVRDSVGSVVGIVADPLSAIPGGVAMTAISAAGAGGGALDGRARLLDASNALERNSVDYYAALRSVSAQRRAKLVLDGRAGLVQPDPQPGGMTAD